MTVIIIVNKSRLQQHFEYIISRRKQLTFL